MGIIKLDYEGRTTALPVGLLIHSFQQKQKTTQKRVKRKRSDFGSAAISSCCSEHTDCLTSFESCLPVFAVEVGVDEAPEDVGPVGQREGVEELWHSQGGQLAEL